MSRTSANTLVSDCRLTNRLTGIGKPRSIVATRACDAGFSATVLWLDILKIGMISQVSRFSDILRDCRKTLNL